MARVELTAEPRALLDPARRPTDFEVLGLGLGDPISRVPVELVEAGDARMASTRVGEAYPIHEQLADVAAHGGAVRIRAPGRSRTDAVLTIEGERITFVRAVGLWLVDLALDAPRAVTRALGETDHRERRNGFETWVWPHRHMTLGFYNSGLFSVGFGDVRPMALECCFEATDLIRLALEWVAKHRGSRAWPMAPHPGSRSDAVLARRLESLLRAFGVARLKLGLFGRRWEPENPLAAFLDGSFLLGISEARVDMFSRHLQDPENGLPHQLERREDGPESPHDIVSFWARMLRLRGAMDEVLRFNSGVLEAGWGYFLLSVMLAGSTARRLEEDRARFDAMLALLMDPERRALPWGQLVREFDFPDEDYERLAMGER